MERVSMTARTRGERWRLILSQPACGLSHMAIDQSLLRSAALNGFSPTIRYYRWSPPALSIGRFQSIYDIDLDACARKGIDVVRRPTGGKCILHMDDFTYSLVFPARYGLPDNVVESYALLCEGVLAALGRLGLDAVIQSRDRGDHSHASGACFAAFSEADLECSGRKICGSAQVRRSGAVLQHGSIIIRDNSKLLFELLHFKGDRHRKRALAEYRDRCTPLSAVGCNCTWDEIAMSFRESFSERFHVEIEEGDLSEEEKARCSRLEHIYNSSQWLMNAKGAIRPQGL